MTDIVKIPTTNLQFVTRTSSTKVLTSHKLLQKPLMTGNQRKNNDRPIYLLENRTDVQSKTQKAKNLTQHKVSPTYSQYQQYHIMVK